MEGCGLNFQHPSSSEATAATSPAPPLPKGCGPDLTCSTGGIWEGEHEGGPNKWEAHSVDKGRFGSFMKLCDFTLLFMTLQVELRLNKKDH